MLVIDVSRVALAALRSRAARGTQETTGPREAHFARVSRGARVPLVSFKASNACPDASGPCGEKGQVRNESLVSRWLRPWDAVG